MSAYPKIKLTYFAAVGRAEAIRLAFYMGGVPFVDERINHPQFKELKPSLPYGKVPVLEVDGQVFAESQAILRYAGRLAKLYPVNHPLAAIKIDEIISALDEMHDKMGPSFRESDPAKKKALREELASVTLPLVLGRVEARLAKLKEMPLFQFREILIHDIVIYTIVQMFRAGYVDHIPVTLTSEYKEMNAVFEKVALHPRVKEWKSKQHMPPALKLTYLPITGRAEPIRLAFHIGGIAFEDERIDREELEARRPTLPFGQLPVLDIAGETISQTMPILRYAGTLAGLYPTNNPALAFRIDEVFCVLDELQSNIGPHYREQDPDKKAAIVKKLTDETIPDYLGALDKRVASWNCSHTVGSTLTVADLAIYGVIDGYKSGTNPNFPVTIAQPFKQLLRIHELVLAHPKVAEWYKTHSH